MRPVLSWSKTRLTSQKDKNKNKLQTNTSDEYKHKNAQENVNKPNPAICEIEFTA